MRPVLLEMAGFGSFREPTTVDFTGAEYFALVGPTGSGKSTVIDAMTFALYGSVPRWDNARTVALALAPTVARGTVRFVFDVAAARAGAAGRWERYVVARELRRAASGGVSVRTARLERLRDPAGTGAPSEETEPVADGAAATTKAVEDLLGLPFGDFTTCVVLPQGEFAEFLHTEPRKRQETLVRLLGLGVYDVIAKEANLEARSQEQRAQVLTEQLGGYGDATAESERAAAERVTELGEVRTRVEAAVPLLTATTAELAEIEVALRRLETERSRLTGLAAPTGLEGLASRRRSAEAALTAARAELDTAEAADSAAREAVAAAPARGPLEEARRRHAERAGIAAELPGARERQAKARDADALAGADAAAARSAVEAARLARDASAAALAEARDAGSRVAAERDALRAVAAPAGLDALEDRRSAAIAALDGAAAALAAAERADADARGALAAAPERAPLEQARRDRHDLDDARAAHAAALTAADTARRALAEASARVERTGAHVEHARARRAARLRADLAAALRPGLVAGEECPVCAQAVAVLPAPLPEGDLAAADTALAAAEDEHDEARRAEAGAAAAHARAAAAQESAATAVERLTEALAALVLPGGPFDAVAPGGERGIPSVPVIEAALAHLDGLARAGRAADEALRRARTERDGAAAEVEAVRTQAVSAVAALRSARDPLVGLGAPAVDDADPVAGWSALRTWAAAEADAREAALPTARARYAEAQREHTDAEQALQSAESAAEERRREETAAARAEQEATGLVAHLEERERALAAALRDAPADDEAAAALERIAALEEVVRGADAALRSARAAARAAESAAGTVERQLAERWAELRSARDPLVALDAPAVGGDDLVAAWAGLVEWAAAAAEVRAERIREAEQARSASSARRAEVAARILDDLAAHGVALDGWAEAVVAPEGRATRPRRGRADAVAAPEGAPTRSPRRRARRRGCRVGRASRRSRRRPCRRGHRGGDGAGARAGRTRGSSSGGPRLRVSPPTGTPRSRPSRSRRCSASCCAPTAFRGGWSPRRWTRSSPTRRSAWPSSRAASSS